MRRTHAGPDLASFLHFQRNPRLPAVRSVRVLDFLSGPKDRDTLLDVLIPLRTHPFLGLPTLPTCCRRPGRPATFTIGSLGSVVFPSSISYLFCLFRPTLTQTDTDSTAILFNEFHPGCFQAAADHLKRRVPRLMPAGFQLTDRDDTDFRFICELLLTPV